MAHPYTTRARVQVAAIARDLASIADRDRDGAEDPGVLAGCIERACNVIDGELGKRFEVPFAATDGVASAGQLADIADELTIVFLLRPIDRAHADSIEAMAMAALAKIARGDTYINATERTVHRRRGGVKVLSAGTKVAGRVDGNYSTNGSDKDWGI